MENTDQYKSRLREVLESYGFKLTNQKPPRIRCIEPGHGDEHPSCIVYEDRLFCPVCNKSWDVFDLMKFTESAQEFPEQLKYVKRALGIGEEKTKRKTKPKSTKKKPDKEPAKPVCVDKMSTNKIYSIDAIGDFCERKKMNHGKIIQRWPYVTKDGKVKATVVRFEDAKGKTIITFWYDGKYLRVKNPPALLYNLEEFYKSPNKPVLVVEGEKAAEAARKLTNYVTVTWNGGTARINKPDWTPLKKRTVVIYPDDDNQPGKEWYQQPGIKAAFELQKILPHAEIIRPPESARKIKDSGADIVEALEVMTPDEITDYIKGAERLKIPDMTDREKSQGNAFPFTILGTADDGQGYFIGINNRILCAPLTGITNTFLLNLVPIDWWENEYSNKGRIDWETSKSDLILACSQRDFNPSTLRGRGAWRTKNGICYYDGKNIYGKSSDEFIFIRRNQKPMGLNANVATRLTTNEISEAVAQLSFEHTVDAIRLLAWAAIAPFAGALPWRPAALLTGPSKSGKTTILDMVIKPIANPLILAGGTTSEAGVRQTIKCDAEACIIEEAEPNTKRRREVREDLFALMRQSTSENAPRAAKGTTDQKGMSFEMHSIFMFVSISPEVDFAADDNRFIRINLKRPSDKWAPKRDRIRSLITDDNCKGIRALTWKKLDKIINLAHKLTAIIQDETGADNRLSLSEGILLATYYLVWLQMDDMNDVELKSAVSEFYEHHALEQDRNDTEELIDRILDEQVQVEKPQREKMSLREILYCVFTGESPENEDSNELMDTTSLLHGKEKAHLRGVAGRYGVGVIDQGDLCIAMNHHEIMKIAQVGKGYHRMLWRHDKLLEKSKVCMLAGKSRRCVVIGGIIEKPETRGNDETESE